MATKTLAKFIYDTLTQAGWPGLTLDEVKQSIKIPIGEVLSLKKGEYHLKFYWYSVDKKEYSPKEKFGEIIFPKNYDIRDLLFFRNSGNYKLSRETQFKNIVNPLGKNVKKLRLSLLFRNQSYSQKKKLYQLKKQFRLLSLKLCNRCQ